MKYTRRRRRIFLQPFVNVKTLGILATLLVLLAIPVTISLIRQPTETQSNATASTSLSFSTPNIQAHVGDQISADIIMIPGNNLVSFVNLVIGYDSSVVTPAQNGFIPNTQAFPTTLDGPTYNTCSGIQCTMSISLSVGNDPLKAINAQTTVATVNFVAVGPATGSQLTFDSKTQILSVAKSDTANGNVLSTATPASLTVSGNTTFTPTPTLPSPSISVTPFITPTPTQSIGNSPTPPGNLTPTPTLSGTCKDDKQEKEREKRENMREKNEELREKMEDIREHKRGAPPNKEKQSGHGGCVGKFDPNNPNNVSNCNNNNQNKSVFDTITIFFKNIFGGSANNQ